MKYSGLGILGAGGAFMGRLTFHLTHTALTDVPMSVPLPPGFIDDASRLNLTRVQSIVPIAERVEEAEQQLVQLIQQARQTNQKVAMAGAQHTMGGHTITLDGIIIDTKTFNQMTLDASTQTLQVQSGATWAQVIQYLDAKGFSVQVMQSYNDFCVGGTLSANAHGWQVNHPPIASTVQSFRILLASGEIKNCSRTENAELFSLALGGYGAFGIILDVQLRVIRNTSYHSERCILAPEAFAQHFATQIDEKPEVDLFFARLSIETGDFLNEVMVYTFNKSADPVRRLDQMPPHSAKMERLKRLIIRGSVDSRFGKWVRWESEKFLSEQMGQTSFTRNELLQEGANTIQHYSEKSTSILHEYFVPYAKFNDFVLSLRRIIPQYEVDLLNVTIRDVKTDEDSFLKYAQGPRFAFVLLFEQNRTLAAEQQMQEVTQALIDAALSLEGSYYLPYRLHATNAQFEQSYPMAKDFFQLKEKYDPDSIFENRFLQKYSSV
ncbi:MAG: FAD-binding oxidoreductase [Opitutaceae bacterium]